MAIHDDRGQDGGEGLHAIRRLLRRKLVSFCVDDLNREAIGAHERGDEACPDRIFDRGQPFAQRLVNACAAAGINENEVRGLHD